jgi:hypothetical protein
MHEAILRAGVVCISANPKFGNARNASSGSAGLPSRFSFFDKADSEVAISSSISDVDVVW